MKTNLKALLKLRRNVKDQDLDPFFFMADPVSGST